jgi:hypothetical protein
MDAVIEIHVIGQPMHFHPVNRFARAIALPHRLQVAHIVKQHGVAVHARFRRRNSCIRGGFHAGMAVATVDAVVSRMMFVAELYGLIARDVSIGDIRRPCHHQNCGQGHASEYGCAQQTESCEKVRTSVKDLCHVRFAPVSRALRKGICLGETTLYAEQRGPGSLIDRIVSNNFCGNATSKQNSSKKFSRNSLESNLVMRSNVPKECT